jgi:hypothetical protein
MQSIPHLDEFAHPTRHIPSGVRLQTHPRTQPPTNPECRVDCEPPYRCIHDRGKYLTRNCWPSPNGCQKSAVQRIPPETSKHSAAVLAISDQRAVTHRSRKGHRTIAVAGIFELCAPAQRPQLALFRLRLTRARNTYGLTHLLPLHTRPHTQSAV